jgi:hypothetical protein
MMTMLDIVGLLVLLVLSQNPLLSLRAGGADLCSFFWSNGFCAPRGPEAGLVFSLSWFSRWWRGAVFFFWSNGFALRAGQSAGLVFSLSWFSRWWRGAGFFFWSNGFALRAGQR